jgi:hypothetical protein
MNRPERLVIVDVDGVRCDIFRAALAAGDLPNVEQIVGGREGYYFGALTRGCMGGPTQWLPRRDHVAAGDSGWRGSRPLRERGRPRAQRTDVVPTALALLGW